MNDNIITEEQKGALISIIKQLKSLNPEYFDKNLSFLKQIIEENQIKKNDSIEQKLRELARQNQGEYKYLLHKAANCFSNTLRDLNLLVNRLVGRDYETLNDIKLIIEEGKIHENDDVIINALEKIISQRINYSSLLKKVQTLFM